MDPLTFVRNVICVCVDAEATSNVTSVGHNIAIAVWCGIVSFVLFKLIDIVIGLRVSEEEETEGLDLTQHDERGYNF